LVPENWLARATRHDPPEGDSEPVSAASFALAVRDGVCQSRRLGAAVEQQGVTAVGAVPEAVGRAAYRIVQERLTNARKHSRGAAVTVRVS
jgi:signal transduction histidine kinase